MRMIFNSILKFLGQLPLWFLFAILGILSIGIPIYITNNLLLTNGQRILEEHEIVDLADESNLRVIEMREELNYLSQDLRKLGIDCKFDEANELQEASKNQIQAFIDIWNSSATIQTQQSELRELRQRYFSESIDAVYVVELGRNPAAFGDANQIRIEKYLYGKVPNPETGELVLEGCQRLCREDQAPSYFSDLRLLPARVQVDEKVQWKQECFLALTRAVRREDSRPTHAIIAVLNFTKAIQLRRLTSPRHQYILFASDETILIHPDQNLIGRKLTEATKWDYPPMAQAKANDELEDRQKRIARMVRAGGSRINLETGQDGRIRGTKVDVSMNSYYLKGHFGSDYGTNLELALNLMSDIDRLNQQLIDAARSEELADLRFSVVDGRSVYIEISHNHLEPLLAGQRLINAWWEESKSSEQGRISWIQPLACERFQGQLVYLRMDTNDVDEPARMIVAASLEELSEDISSQFRRIIIWRVLPITLVTMLLNIPLVFMITYSLRRLAKAAKQQTTTGEAVPIVGGGCSEVTDLATAFRALVSKLQDDTVRVQSILNSAGEGIVVASSEGIIQEANPAAARMFGYAEPQELVNTPIKQLVFDEAETEALSSKGLLESTLVPANGETVKSSVRGRRKDGSAFWLDVTLRPVELKENLAITAIFRDVTQKKLAEAEIQRMNEELEDRVRLRTAELAEANTKLSGAVEQAEAAARAKDTFVANMSHELRQPLHTITGYTELLKEEAIDTGREELLPDLNKILSASKHLLSLINDILDLAKINAGQMQLNLEEFTLDHLIQDVKNLVEPLAHKNKNQFIIDMSPNIGTMIADELRLRQILINLLSNSFKFTQHGTVTLSVRRLTSRDPERIEFSVSDTGQGMTEEQVSRLFERFYQADDGTTRRQGGTGLGLAISQSFTELMQGDPIEVTSRQGHGSNFIVRLPAVVQLVEQTKLKKSRSVDAPREESLPRGSVAGRVGPACGTILVIDDDEHVRELMTRFLNKEGFEVIAAANGAEGFKLAMENHPIAITLDVMMPELDGWNTLTKLKAEPSTCGIPVVMLTIVDERGRGYALGAADYLTKPIDWPRLSQVLKRYQVPKGNAPVLVVDDDGANREMVCRFLERNGIPSLQAANGMAALQSIAIRMPALILLDLMMPVLDGFGFLEELQTRFPGAKIPVIVLTAKDLTSEDYHRLNGRVMHILAKGELTQFEQLASLIQKAAVTMKPELETPKG